MKTSGPIDLTTRNLPVSGINLKLGMLGDQFGEFPTLLVFLRHLG